MREDLALALTEAELKLEKMGPGAANEFLKKLVEKVGIEDVALLFRYVRDLVVGEESLKVEIERQMLIVDAFQKGVEEGDEGTIFSTTRFMKEAGKFWLRAGERSIVGLGMILSFFHENWEEVPQELKDDCVTFGIFAEQFTGKSYSSCMSYINVFKTWFSGKYKLPEGFDPWKVDPTKLLICTGKFHREAMREKDWAVLSDEESSWEDVREVVYEIERPETNTLKLGLSTNMIEGTITAFKGRDVETVGQFYPKIYKQSELAREAVDFIIHAANITRMEE